MSSVGDSVHLPSSLTSDSGSFSFSVVLWFPSPTPPWLQARLGDRPAAETCQPLPNPASSPSNVKGSNPSKVSRTSRLQLPALALLLALCAGRCSGLLAGGLLPTRPRGQLPTRPVRRVAGRGPGCRGAASSAAMPSPEEALSFCRTVGMARKWLHDSGVKIVHESSVEFEQASGVLAAMALYHGEDWLVSNCWYMESPLPEGPPDGPFAGAKWKAALTFREKAPMHVFVVDAGNGSRMWSGKYGIRESMRRAVGSIGNSCLHLTDDQAGELRKWRAGQASQSGGGYECNSSYAYHCARVLLNPHSVAFLNKGAGADLGDSAFVAKFDKYCAWLADPSFEDVSAGGDFRPPPL